MRACFKWKRATARIQKRFRARLLARDMARAASRYKLVEKFILRFRISSHNIKYFNISATKKRLRLHGFENEFDIQRKFFYILIYFYLFTFILAEIEIFLLPSPPPKYCEFRGRAKVGLEKKKVGIK